MPTTQPFIVPRLRSGPTRSAWIRQVLLLIISLLLLHPAPGQTDPLRIYRVKAGFIFNFSRFTEWSPESLPSNQPLRIGILGKPEVIAAIEAELAGKMVGTHPVVVVSPETDQDWASLHVLFVTASSPLSERDLIGRLGTPGLLTIGDAPNFAEKAGIIAFFERDGKLRFRINPATAKASGLQVSGQLASLAEVIRR